MYTWCRVIARIIRGNQVGDIDAQTRRRSQVDRSRQFIWYAGSNLYGMVGIIYMVSDSLYGMVGLIYMVSGGK